jgi:hypothetical protein
MIDAQRIGGDERVLTEGVLHVSWLRGKTREIARQGDQRWEPETAMSTREEMLTQPGRTARLHCEAKTDEKDRPRLIKDHRQVELLCIC